VTRGRTGPARGRLGSAAILLLACLLPGCARDTSRLTPEWQARFETEGILRRADNIVVRHTRQAGRYESGYKDRLASVVVTKGTLLIHQEGRVLLEVTPRTRREIEVRRVGSRIRIRAAGERITEIFSFQPDDDAEGWVEDARAVAALSRTPARIRSG
jgi:hypothetical protein